MSVSTAKLSLEVSDVQTDEDCDDLVGADPSFHLEHNCSMCLHLCSVLQKKAAVCLESDR